MSWIQHNSWLFILFKSMEQHQIVLEACLFSHRQLCKLCYLRQDNSRGLTGWPLLKDDISSRWTNSCRRQLDLAGRRATLGPGSGFGNRFCNENVPWLVVTAMATSARPPVKHTNQRPHRSLILLDLSEHLKGLVFNAITVFTLDSS